MKFDNLGLIRADDFESETTPRTGDVCNREGTYEALCLMGAARIELASELVRERSTLGIVDLLTTQSPYGLLFIRYPQGEPDSNYLCTSADQTIPWIVARTFSREPLLKIAISHTFYMLCHRWGFFLNSVSIYLEKPKKWYEFTDVARPGVWAALIRSRDMLDSKWMLKFLDFWHLLDALVFCHIYDGDDDIQWLLMIEQGKRKWPTLMINLADKYYRAHRKIDAIESYYTSRQFKAFIPMWREVRQK